MTCCHCPPPTDVQPGGASAATGFEAADNESVTSAIRSLLILPALQPSGSYRISIPPDTSTVAPVR